jgi:hypothetical protein
MGHRETDTGHIITADENNWEKRKTSSVYFLLLWSIVMRIHSVLQKPIHFIQMIMKPNPDTMKKILIKSLMYFALYLNVPIMFSNIFHNNISNHG